jgi:hypothetical protein
MATLRESDARCREASCAGNGQRPWQAGQRSGGVCQAPPEGGFTRFRPLRCKLLTGRRMSVNLRLDSEIE